MAEPRALSPWQPAGGTAAAGGRFASPARAARRGPLQAALLASLLAHLALLLALRAPPPALPSPASALEVWLAAPRALSALASTPPRQVAPAPAGPTPPTRAAANKAAAAPAASMIHSAAPLPARVLPAAPTPALTRTASPGAETPALPALAAPALPALAAPALPTAAAPALPPSGDAAASTKAVAAPDRQARIRAIARDLEHPRPGPSSDRPPPPGFAQRFDAALPRPPQPLVEIPLAEGGTMVSMPGGGCMVSDGTPNAATPPEKRVVRYTSHLLDPRCPG